MTCPQPEDNPADAVKRLRTRVDFNMLASFARLTQAAKVYEILSVLAIYLQIELNIFRIVILNTISQVHTTNESENTISRALS